MGNALKLADAMASEEGLPADTIMRTVSVEK